MYTKWSDAVGDLGAVSYRLDNSFIRDHRSTLSGRGSVISLSFSRYQSLDFVRTAIL